MTNFFFFQVQKKKLLKWIDNLPLCWLYVELQEKARQSPC